MKITYEFNPHEPEDLSDLKKFQQTEALHLVAWEFSNNTRRLLKYQEVSEEFEKGFDYVFEEFNKLIELYNIDLDVVN